MDVKVLGISLGFPIIFALGIGVCPFHLFFYVYFMNGSTISAMLV